MAVIALIPARGGSKGIPGKNIYPIAGKPLLNYSVDAAKNARAIDSIWVSTDDREIKSTALAAGACVIDRPAELADDTSLTADMMRHFIEENSLAPTDTLVLLQPTSPLRTAEDIDLAMEKYFEANARLLISVEEPEHCLLKAFVMNDEGYLEGAFSPEAPFTPRQALPKTYLPNGAIYVVGVDDFIKAQGFPEQSIVPYVMPKERSVDIDNLSDVTVVETILEQSK